MATKSISGSGCSVSVKNVDKMYGSAEAVREINLEIAEGEFLTLLGPSGSGKTTLLMILAGFVTPSAGTVEIAGTNVTDLAPHRRNIGMVFQSYALFPHMTVYDNIAFPLQARKFDRAAIDERVAHALSLVKLENLAHRYPRQLSGGQQQRVALARAVVFGPPLLLMDEPLSALDKKLREQMQLELINIKKELNRTVVYVTHDQEEAQVMSDRVVVMADGRIQQIGTAEVLYEQPANRFVANFIGVANLIDGIINGQDGELIHVETPSGLKIAVLATSRCSPEHQVSVVLRPEKIRLGAEARGSTNAYSGRVTQVIHLGEATRVSIELDNGIVVVARKQNVRYRSEYEIGDVIEVGWEPDQITIV